MRKILGYILAAIGIIGIAMYSIPEVNQYVTDFGRGFTGDDSFEIADTILVIVSAAILLAGLFILVKMRKAPKSPSEVPIYSGEKVVGFRRT